MSKQSKSLGVKYLVPNGETTIRASLPKGAKLLRIKGLTTYACPTCATKAEEKYSLVDGVLTLVLLNPTRETVECRPVVEYEAPEEAIAVDLSFSEKNFGTAIDDKDPVVTLSEEDVSLDDVHDRVTSRLPEGEDAPGDLEPEGWKPPWAE